MSEWWSYRLSDFLMFAPVTYWRLVELYNRANWPLHLLMLGAGLLVTVWVWAKPADSARGVARVLAAAWLWVAWAFHGQRYAQVNWAAEYLAIAFAVQAVLLLSLNLFCSEAKPVGGPRARQLGLALAVTGLVLYPALAPMLGRPWSQAEVFGVMPEPTALVTIGLLLAAGKTARGVLVVIPALSLAIGWTTLWMLST